MRVGNVVQNKLDKAVYGTIEYSTFGFSIHVWREHEGKPILGKTLGCSANELLQDWKVLSSLPRGYVRHIYGGVVKDD